MEAKKQEYRHPKSKKDTITIRYILALRKQNVKKLIIYGKILVAFSGPGGYNGVEVCARRRQLIFW